MTRFRFVGVLAVLLVLVGFVAAADDPLALTTAQGTVDKVEKDTLAIRPRGPDGKFGKSLVLKLTGTSKVTTLSAQTRSGKQVLVQRDTDAKDLQPKQAVTVIYTTLKEGPVLLAAVALPPGEK